MLEGLLPTLDTFEQAKGMVKTDSEEAQKVADSYQGVYKGLLQALSGFGLKPVQTEGVQFDPETMEAIMRQPNEEMEDGAVVQEFRMGFTLNETLLRPAMVAVCVNESAEGTAADLGDSASQEKEG